MDHPQTEQHGDLTECRYCGQRWDTNDPAPPLCSAGASERTVPAEAAAASKKEPEKRDGAGNEGSGTVQPGSLQAHVLLRAGANAIADRAASRDVEAERSMARCVNAFNAMTGHQLSEKDGWQFMELLKMARSRAGAENVDDYVDGASYAALAGECALTNDQQ